MIVIQAAMRMKPDQREPALAAFAAVMRGSQAEPGCVSYLFTLDLADPLLVHVTEIWQDEPALLAHFQRAPFNDFMAQVPVLVDPVGMSALQGPLQPYAIPGM